MDCGAFYHFWYDGEWDLQKQDFPEMTSVYKFQTQICEIGIISPISIYSIFPPMMLLASFIQIWPLSKH